MRVRIDKRPFALLLAHGDFAPRARRRRVSARNRHEPFEPPSPRSALARLELQRARRGGLVRRRMSSMSSRSRLQLAARPPRPPWPPRRPRAPEARRSSNRSASGSSAPRASPSASRNARSPRAQTRGRGAPRTRAIAVRLNSSATPRREPTKRSRAARNHASLKPPRHPETLGERRVHTGRRVRAARAQRASSKLSVRFSQASRRRGVSAPARRSASSAPARIAARGAARVGQLALAYPFGRLVSSASRKRLISGRRLRRRGRRAQVSP